MAHHGVPTPSALIHGAAFQTVDFSETELQLKADATGTAFGYGAKHSGGQLSTGEWLRIERIVITSNSANDCECGFYLGDDDPPLMQRIRDWTPLPAGDVGVSEYPSYLTIYPGRSLAVNITGANPNDLFFISYAWQLVQKVTGSWPGGTG